VPAVIFVLLKKAYILKPYEYDAFLSFAVEDKIEIATLLHHKLEEKGLKVWYSGRELLLGSSIQSTITEGLLRSRFAILLISPHYFKTEYTLQELGALWSRETENRKVIIPVFHRITPQEVGLINPALAERWALSTEIGLDQVCDKIAKYISASDETIATRQKKTRQKKWFATLLLIALCLTALMFWRAEKEILPRGIIIDAVTLRLREFQSNLEKNLSMILAKQGAEPTSREEVIRLLDSFSTIEAQYRNFYEFTNGITELQFEKNVGPASGIDFESWSPVDNYGFKYPQIYMAKGNTSTGAWDLQFFFFNTQETRFEIDKTELQDSLTVVTINYTEPLRLVIFHYAYGPQTSQRKHTTYSIHGFMTQEQYYFSNIDDKWTLTQIK